jgi:predicted porin
MRRHSLGALVAAGLLAGGLTTSASAADLGGNCCADLEERIAELEATTVRKGNRKVSLTISGWVAEQVMWWDNGIESNVYVGGVGTTLSSHFKMTGQATIAPGYQAGYVIHVETNSNEPLGWNERNDDGSGPKVDLLQSFWFINSDRMGKLSVGQMSHASDNVAILVDGSGSLVPANWVNFDNQAFRLVSGNQYLNATWGELQYCQHIGAGIGGDCNGVPQNAVRYDTPVFAGFSASASWGEDDFWDVAARYAGEWNGVKVAVAAAYSHYSDEHGPGGGRADVVHLDSDYFQIGAFVQHVPTGLFVYGAYGHENNDSLFVNNVNGHDGDMWYLKAGLRRKWHEWGHTVLFGEYQRRDDMYRPGLTIEGLDVVGSNTDMWGLGIVQEIDAAAMSLWLTYRHHSGDVDLTNGELRGNADLEDFDLIKFGALINF